MNRGPFLSPSFPLRIMNKSGPCSFFFFRVHAHTSSALINFWEGVERDTLLPYFDPIVECLLKLLDPAGDPARCAGTGDDDASYGDGSK